VNLIAYNPIDEEDFQRPTRSVWAALQICAGCCAMWGGGVVRASRGLDEKCPAAASSRRVRWVTLGWFWQV